MRYTNRRILYSQACVRRTASCGRFALKTVEKVIYNLINCLDLALSRPICCNILHDFFWFYLGLYVFMILLFARNAKCQDS